MESPDDGSLAVFDFLDVEEEAGWLPEDSDIDEDFEQHSEHEDLRTGLQYREPWCGVPGELEDESEEVRVLQEWLSESLDDGGVAWDYDVVDGLY